MTEPLYAIGGVFVGVLMVLAGLGVRSLIAPRNIIPTKVEEPETIVRNSEGKRYRLDSVRGMHCLGYRTEGNGFMLLSESSVYPEDRAKWRAFRDKFSAK